MPNEFPGNSHSQRAPVKPEKNIQRVTQSKPRVRKKPFGTRFKETFAGDGSKGVFEYVMADVIVPAIKDLIADAVIGATERKLFGEARGYSRSRGPARSPGAGGMTVYNRMNVPGPPTRREDPRAVGHRGRASFDFNQYLLGSRAEANEVLTRMFDILGQYEVVSVRDFFDLIGEDAAHTDEKWGWTDLRGSVVHRAGDGYLIDLPRPEPIE